MLKEAGLLPPHCRMHSPAAWDSAHPSSIIAAACCEYGKAKTDKDKNDFEAMRKEEEMLIDNSRGVHWDIFFSLFVIKHSPLPLLWPTLQQWEMQEVNGSGHDVWWFWLKRSPAVETLLLIYEVYCMPWKVAGKGGRVFVETYLSVIYHSTTPPLTFLHWLVCELDTNHGSNIMDNVAGECTRARG